jgi:hypothetical protein
MRLLEITSSAPDRLSSAHSHGEGRASSSDSGVEGGHNGSGNGGGEEGAAEGDTARLHEALFTRDLLELQRAEQSHTAFGGGERSTVEVCLEGYVHETARRSINVLDEVAERRAVVVAFAKVVGLEAAFEATLDGLGAVQRCVATALECIARRGGLLRQFILDDKGVVIIWIFGLTQVRFAQPMLIRSPTLTRPAPVAGLRTPRQTCMMPPLSLGPSTGIL